jgi:predicted subunit of tRNA(5-methylaminomethyl-2-thiouridylate) methyltransferase
MSIVDTIKKCVTDQLNHMQLTNITIGTVTSIEPLEIETQQEQIFTQKVLILSKNVTDHEIEMSIEHETEEHTHAHIIEDTYSGGGVASDNTHLHEYKGRKIFKVHKALEVGEKVILIKQQGGQKYYVIDRLGGNDDTI